jgi:hypothetical protein
MSGRIMIFILLALAALAACARTLPLSQLCAYPSMYCCSAMQVGGPESECAYVGGQPVVAQ